jgi:hypothetical protein
MDCVGILRELRILAIEIQTDRFYALYVLLAFILIIICEAHCAGAG